jgi:allophanate hydrolase
VERAFDAIANIDDPAIFISTTDRERSLAAVDPALPLAGVTFAAKNNIDVAGLATTAGCPSYAYDPGESAIVVQRLTNAGATCIGATNLDQFATVGAFLETEPLDANPTVSGIIRGASTRTAIEAYEAQYRLDELRRAADDTWARVDVLMVPTTPGVATLAEVEADPIGRNSELGTYTNWVNLLDRWAVAVPGADHTDGWPFGVTFLGAAWSDDTVIELAQRFSTDPPAADQHPYSSSGGIDIVVVDAHLHEQPLNWQLTDHGGRLIRACRTAPGYQLYALGGGGIPKPALVRRNEPGDGHGSSTIEVEVWRLPAAEFGVFSQYVPAPLGLGRVDLDDGTSPTGFIAEPAALDGATDITRHGGWRSYLRDRS